MPHDPAPAPADEPAPYPLPDMPAELNPDSAPASEPASVRLERWLTALELEIGRKIERTLPQPATTPTFVFPPFDADWSNTFTLHVGGTWSARLAYDVSLPSWTSVGTARRVVRRGCQIATALRLDSLEFAYAYEHPNKDPLINFLNAVVRPVLLRTPADILQVAVSRLRAGKKEALQSNRQAITNQVNALSSLQANLAAAHTDLGDLRAKQTCLAKMSTKSLRKSSEGWLNFLSAQVELEADDNAITAVTEEIELEGVTLGPFTITVDLRNLAINVEADQNKSSKGFPHPHISESGYPCWGDLKDAVITATKEGDALQLLVYAVTLLNSYSSGNSYQRLDKWERGENWCDNCETDHGEDGCDAWCGDCENYANNNDDHVWCRRCDSCYSTEDVEEHYCPNCNHHRPEMCSCCSVDAHCTSCCADVNHEDGCEEAEEEEPEPEAVPEPESVIEPEPEPQFSLPISAAPAAAKEEEVLF